LPGADSRNRTSPKHRMDLLIGRGNYPENRWIAGLALTQQMTGASCAASSSRCESCCGITNEPVLPADMVLC
jgi:hypothetical protein